MTETKPREPSPTPDSDGGAPGTGPDGRVLRSDELLRGANEVLIEHQGNLYRLRLTRSGKLILHK